MALGALSGVMSSASISTVVFMDVDSRVFDILSALKIIS